MKKVIILTGNINYDIDRVVKKLSELPEYNLILHPETKVLHPTFQFTYDQRIRENSIIVTFNKNIIDSLIFSLLQGDIELEIYYNNHEVNIDELGYIVRDEYSEDFLIALPKFVEKLSDFRLRKIKEDANNEN